MGDTFRKVRTGEALRIPAQAYNAFIDAARFVRDQEREQTGEALGLNFRRIRIKNISGADRSRFHVLGIDDPLFTPNDNLNGFRNQTSFKGATPDIEEHKGRFAILLEPAKPDKIVLAQVTGVCPVQIAIGSEDHEYADIKDGDATKLQSALHGSARTLWKAPGTGTQWAVVALAWPSPLILPGKITAVAGDGTAGDATYDAESTHGPKVTVGGVSPVNRPFADSDIEPAAVGDDCLLYTNEEGDEVRLIQLTEVVKFDECDPPQEQATDGGKRMLRAEVDGVMQFSGFTAAEERDFILSRVIKHAERHEPGGEDAMVVDAVAAIGSLRTLGDGAQQACAGNDLRLSDARTPIAHAASHQHSGSDEIAVASPAANAIPKAGSGGRLATGWGMPSILVAQRKNNTVTGTGDQNLFRVSIPGGTLGTNKGLRFVAVLRRTTGTGNGTFKASFGGTRFATFGALTSASLMLTGLLWANGATDAQRGNMWASPGSYGQGTAAVDSTAAQNFDIDVAPGTSTDVWIADWFSVEVLE